MVAVDHRGFEWIDPGGRGDLDFAGSDPDHFHVFAHAGCHHAVFGLGRFDYKPGQASPDITNSSFQQVRGWFAICPLPVAPHTNVCRFSDEPGRLTRPGRDPVTIQHHAQRHTGTRHGAARRGPARHAPAGFGRAAGLDRRARG